MVGHGQLEQLRCNACVGPPTACMLLHAGRAAGDHKLSLGSSQLFKERYILPARPFSYNIDPVLFTKFRFQVRSTSVDVDAIIVLQDACSMHVHCRIRCIMMHRCNCMTVRMITIDDPYPIRRRMMYVSANMQY